jgi:aerobic-type carbon monoxide dehydrogenase small subunit (CoxS/CutS family)
MISELTFTLNGKPVTHSAETQRTLLDVLREDLGLTGTKFGCGEGACRACTVLMDGKPVQSCLTTFDEVSGRKIETIEGLSKEGGEMHPVQAAFLRHDAMQCGYCVPGMIMRAVGFLRTNPADASRERIIEAMNGNLCRCCGYENLIDAIEDAAKSKDV